MRTDPRTVTGSYGQQVVRRVEEEEMELGTVRGGVGGSGSGSVLWKGEDDSQELLKVGTGEGVEVEVHVEGRV